MMSTIVTNGSISSDIPHLCLPADGRAMLVELSDDPAVPVARDLSLPTAEQHSVAQEGSIDAVIHLRDRDMQVTIVRPAADVFGHWQWGFVVGDWTDLG